MNFTKDDFNSPYGMQTTIFGPLIWHTLHTISFNYPINPSISDKKHYTDYILSLQYILPCKLCRENLKKNLKETGFNKSVMKNRDTFSRYIYKLHNKVNKELGKTEYLNLTYNDIRDRYECCRARCSKDEATDICANSNTYVNDSKLTVNIVKRFSKIANFKISKPCLPVFK